MNDPIKNVETWIRGFFILVFIVFISLLLYSPLKLVLLAAITIQFGFVLFSGQLNEQLLNITRFVCDYLYQVMLYITFNTEDKPFPFNKLPPKS